MRDLVFACIWAALLPLCVLSAFVGVLIWVWVALLSPNELLYSFMSGVPFNKIVAIVTILVVLFGRDKKQPYLDVTQALLVLFAVSATISWLRAIVPGAAADDLYQKLIKDIILVFMITMVMTSRHRVHLLALVTVVSLGFLGVKEGLISLFTMGGHKIIGSGSIGDNNSLATALLMSIPITVYLARYSAVRLIRVGLLVALGLCVVTVVMTFSRGGFIGMLILAVFFIKNSRKKLSSLFLVLIAAGLVYDLAPATWFQRLDTIRNVDNDGSFMGRVVAWKISWLLAMDHPYFGGGPHAVQNLLVWDTYKPLLPSLDFIPTPPPDMYPHAAHSIYFEILGDTGFIGLALFLAAILSAVWNCWWIRRRAREHPSLTWAADLAGMVQVSLILYLVTGAALSMGYFELLYIMLAIVSRCRRIVAQTLAAEAVDGLPMVQQDTEAIFAGAGGAFGA